MCYTVAWSEAITFAVLNVAGLVVAIVSGQWMLKQIYWWAYFPLVLTIWTARRARTTAALQDVDEG